MQLSLALRAMTAEDTDTPAWQIRPSRRARRLQIRVSPWQGVEVVVPPRTSVREVEKFVSTHRKWAARAWAGILREYPDAGSRIIPDSIELAAVNECWQVRQDATVISQHGWRQEANRILIQSGNDEPAEQGAQLRHWLSCRARSVLKPWLAQVAEECGLQYARVQVRGQRTRWGSCSSQSSISLNYKLLFCEPPVVRYLLVHELCHTRHLNHGKRFWKLVEKFEPDCKNLDRQLGESWKCVPAWVEMR